MAWIERVHCEKLQRDFVAWTFALIAPVHPVLHRVSCSYETIPNAPKDYEMHKNMSVGANGVDRVRSLQQILTRLRGTKFCINCTSSVCFAPWFVQLWNHPKELKHYGTHKNKSFPMAWIECFHCEKLQRDFVSRTYTLIAPVHPV